MKFLLAVFAFWSISGFATPASGDDITCKGWVFNNGTEQFDDVELKPASYDSVFLEGNIRNYGLGVDRYFLRSNNSLTIVIVDNKTKATSASTAGWKQIEKTLLQDLNLFVNLPDGSRDQIQISCYKVLP